MCEACLDCRDPHTYCKFRPQCLIDFIWKERNPERVQSASEVVKDEDRNTATVSLVQNYAIAVSCRKTTFQPIDGSTTTG